MNEAIDAIRVISVGVALNLTPILSLIICATLAVGLWYSIAYIRKAKEKAKNDDASNIIDTSLLVQKKLKIWITVIMILLLFVLFMRGVNSYVGYYNNLGSFSFFKLAPSLSMITLLSTAGAVLALWLNKIILSIILSSIFFIDEIAYIIMINAHSGASTGFYLFTLLIIALAIGLVMMIDTLKKNKT